MRPAFPTALSLLATSALAVAQTASSSNTGTRLEQLEATYRSALRGLHAPVIADYLRQLDLLKNQLNAQRRTEDARAVEQEIARIRQIGGTTGILPYSTLEAGDAPPAQNGTPAPAPTPPPPPSGTLASYLGAEAFKSGAMDGKTGAVPLGTAEWRISSLPAGTHEVVILYATNASLSADAPLTVRIGTQELKAVLPAARATDSAATFRIFRLGRLHLDTAVSGGTLVVEGPASAPVWLKKIYFTAPRKGPPPPSA